MGEFAYMVQLHCNGKHVELDRDLSIDEALNSAECIADVLDGTGAEVRVCSAVRCRLHTFARFDADGNFSMLDGEEFAEFLEVAPMNSTKCVCQMPRGVQNAVSEYHLLQRALDSRFCSVVNTEEDYINIARTWLDNKGE